VLLLRHSSLEFSPSWQQPHSTNAYLQHSPLLLNRTTPRQKPPLQPPTKLQQRTLRPIATPIELPAAAGSRTRQCCRSLSAALLLLAAAVAATIAVVSIHQTYTGSTVEADAVRQQLL
jgi:hypothetical protein